MKTPLPVSPQLPVVTFRIGSVEFGLDVFCVHEILRYRSVTVVPRAPAFVQGVIEFRGALVPVIDLRLRFEVDDADTDQDTRIIVVEFAGERLGVVVDSVTEVLQLPESAISDPPGYFRGLAAEYIRGLARWDERLIILLDIDRILSSEERIALETADLDPDAEPATAETEPGAAAATERPGSSA